jgi:hypothetical protein
MTTQTIVMTLVGLAMLVLGYFMTTNEKVARWGLSHGRGRIWATLLGMERAMKLTRYFFGPFTVILGALILVVTFLGR